MCQCRPEVAPHSRPFPLRLNPPSSPVPSGETPSPPSRLWVSTLCIVSTTSPVIPSSGPPSSDESGRVLDFLSGSPAFLGPKRPGPYKLEQVTRCGLPSLPRTLSPLRVGPGLDTEESPTDLLPFVRDRESHQEFCPVPRNVLRYSSEHGSRGVGYHRPRSNVVSADVRTEGLASKSL